MNLVPISVDFRAAFPRGARLVNVVKVRGDAAARVCSAGPNNQETLGDSSWTLTVIDAEYSVPEKQNEVTVQVPGEVQLLPTASVSSADLLSVVFDGLTVTPYVLEREGRPGIGYAFRASGMTLGSATSGTPQ